MNTIWIVLPILIVLMFLLGTEMTKDSFKGIVTQPGKVLLGLFGQIILLPVVAFVIAWVLKLPAIYFMGLVLVACCPGGSSSNVFSMLAKGDVALSVTLTAISSIVTLFTLPVVMNFTSDFVSAQSGVEIVLPVGKLIMQNIVLIFVPLFLGWLFKNYFPVAADKVNKVLSKAAFPALMLMAIVFFLQYTTEIIANFTVLGLATACLILSTMLLSALLTMVFKYSGAVRRTIVIEVGMQNAAQAIAIATSPILLKPEYDSEIGNPDYASMLKAIQTKEPSLEPFTLDDEIRCYHLSKQLISGFNMHWKKAKPSQYAIASSSYILLKSSQNTPVDQMIQIGQKKNEGFGVIHFIPFEKSCELKLDEPSEKNEIGNEVITSPIFLALKQKELAIDYFNDHKNNLIQMNHALLGRMIMMLKDTQDRGYDAFKNCLSDIKDEKKMKDTLDLLKECEKEGFDKGRNYFHFFYTLLTQIKYAQRKGE